MKRFLSILISMMLIVSSVGVAGLADDSGHWAYDSIKSMLEEGIISGDQSGNLNLDNSVTRAEFAKVVNRYFGLTVKSDEGFNDVSEDAWYYNDLLVAKGHGYIISSSYNYQTCHSSIRINIIALNIIRMSFTDV